MLHQYGLVSWLPVNSVRVRRGRKSALTAKWLLQCFLELFGALCFLMLLQYWSLSAKRIHWGKAQEPRRHAFSESLVTQIRAFIRFPMRLLKRIRIVDVVMRLLRDLGSQLSWSWLLSISLFADAFIMRSMVSRPWSRFLARFVHEQRSSRAPAARALWSTAAEAPTGRLPLPCWDSNKLRQPTNRLQQTKHQPRACGKPIVQISQTNMTCSSQWLPRIMVTGSSEIKRRGRRQTGREEGSDEQP